MEVLIGHEESATVREEFNKIGHKAWSCDLQPTQIPGLHFQMPIEEVLELPKKWDFIGLHPVCTYMTNSGVRWLFNSDGSKNYNRWIELEKSVKNFNYLKSKIKVGYLENPIPHKYARDGFNSVIDGKWVEGIGKYDQIVQPWQFGHGEQKATCFWLIKIPKLNPTEIVEGREQRIWKIPPGPERAKLRSKTYPGIAKAMAEQWGNKI